MATVEITFPWWNESGRRQARYRCSRNTLIAAYVEVCERLEKRMAELRAAERDPA